MKSVIVLWLAWVVMTGAALGQALSLQQQNMPTTAEKAALVGTNGIPGQGNEFVTKIDPRILSQAEHDLLVGGTDTVLHRHAYDRARANHTGYQLRSTISDFAHAGTHTNLLDDPLPITHGLKFWGSYLVPDYGTDAYTVCEGNDGRLLTQPQRDDLVAHPPRSISVEGTDATTVETWAAGIEFTGSAIGSVTRDVGGHVVVSIHDSGSSTGSLTPHAATHLSNGDDPISAASNTVRGTVLVANDAESAAGKVVVSTDSRMSNARAPTAHGSDHISTGVDPIPAATTVTGGIVTLAPSGGTGTGTAVQGNDSRLSDARTPTAHQSTHRHGGSDPVPDATTATYGLALLAVSGGTGAGTVVNGADSRLSDGRMTIQEEGATQGSAGAVKAINVVGSGIAASVSGATATFTVPTATTATEGTITLAADGGTTAGTVVEANDSRLGGSTIVWSEQSAIEVDDGLGTDHSFTITVTGGDVAKAGIYRIGFESTAGTTEDSVAEIHAGPSYVTEIIVAQAYFRGALGGGFTPSSASQVIIPASGGVCHFSGAVTRALAYVTQIGYYK